MNPTHYLERRRSYCEALDVDPALAALAAEIGALLPANTPARSSEDLADLVLLLLRAEAEGSTALDLSSLKDRLALDQSRGGHLAPEEEAPEETAARLAAVTAEAESLIAPADAAPDDPRPLRRQGSLLRSARTEAFERELADSVRRRSRHVEDDEGIVARARELARTGSPQLAPGQEAALEAALRCRLGVITGGPGTGKTTVVARVVEALIAEGLTADTLALAAPTGRAAGRLGEALRQAVSHRDDAIAAAMRSLEPRTVHRLLGYRPRDGSYRFGTHHPLPLDALVIDEASMLDVELAGRLFASLTEGTRLVLVGDADQLPSVGRGAVLRDLVEAGGPTVARLEQGFRVDADRDADSARLATLAQSLRDGDASLPSLRRLDDTPGLDAQAFTSGPALAPQTALRELLGAWYERELSGLGSLSEEELLERHRSRRVYTFTRVVDRGQKVVDALLHERHATALGLSAHEPWLPGEPVLVRRNDPARGLANGDLGVIVAREGRLLVRVEAMDARRDEAIFELGTIEASLERAWASTVHKAQGSECDTAVIVLPARSGPFLNRETLYTAVTRCRQHCLIAGSEAALKSAVEQQQERRTGLADRLLALRAES